MRKILSSRIFRILVCLVLVCCFLVNSSPIKAEATGGAAVLGVIKGATLVSVPVAFWVVAGLVALGVMVDVVTDPAYTSYDALVDNATAFLTDAGTYVKDGMVEMIRVVDETGKAVFYTAGDALESLREWVFSSGTVLPIVDSFETIDVGAVASHYALDYYGTEIDISYSVSSASAPVQHFILCSNYHCSVFFSTESFQVVSSSGGTVNSSFRTVNDVSFNVCLIMESGYYGETATCNHYRYNLTQAKLLNYVSDIVGHGYCTNVYTYDTVTLGSVSSVPIDGTGAREWSEEYTNNGLYIVGTGGSGNNNPNDGKWFWPLAFGLTAAELYAMSQADQWAGETPSEFSDYEVKEDYSVSPGQEVEFGQSVELTPDPSANPDPGTGTNPGTGTDPGTNSGSSSWQPPSDMGKFTLDLKQYFPFCIPFDLYAFFTCLNAEPVAPVIEWIIPLPGGKTYPFEIDLSAFDSVAQILRRMQLLLFCVGLAFKTRDLIKG